MLYTGLATPCLSIGFYIGSMVSLGDILPHLLRAICHHENMFGSLGDILPHLLRAILIIVSL
jgi:hypothetical protein